MGALISLCVSPFLFTLYAFIAPLVVSGKVNDKKYNVLNLILDSFNYKSKFFLDLATIGLIYNVFKYFTLNIALAIIPALIVLYIIGEFNINLPEEGMSGFTNTTGIKQAKVGFENGNDSSINICTIPEESEEIQRGGIQRGGKKNKSKKYNIRFV